MSAGVEQVEWKWRLICGNEDDVRPLPRVGHAQATIGDKVYCFGGRRGIDMNEEALNDLWVLDCSGKIGTETWSQVKSRSSPPDSLVPRSFHRMVAVGSDLYVFGGCGPDGRLADLHKFDTITMEWEALGESSLLRGRGGANLVYLPNGINDTNSKLAVIAGFCGEETNDGHRYILNGDKRGWESSLIGGLSELRPRSVCVSGTIPSLGLALIFGGEVNPSDRGHEGAGGFENDIVTFDAQSGSVCSILKAPKVDSGIFWPGNRGWSDGAVFDEGGKTCLYVFGGLTGDDENPVRLADLWRCDLSLDKD
mmetsp:Transcript_5554/g.11576  ORF Transcript_5554/g.11576 Transcript_5554/m.11576 type:complete len:309 (-) Transcript_5554:92-1018(-)